ncbi:MAG TPA: flagellar motor switch protein FliN [Polyangiaceae bacterium]|nr:flagellar motor switch protein FliN [Polyangiaceae bacterium]
MGADADTNGAKAETRAHATPDMNADGPRTGGSLAFVMDVPVEVTVEIGRRSMKIADLLRIGPGSVLELDKAAGEPLDIYVNNRRIARGEAVVVGDRYGVRLTEVVAFDEAPAKLAGGS